MRMLKVSAIPIANGATTPARPATAVAAPAALTALIRFGGSLRQPYWSPTAPTTALPKSAPQGKPSTLRLTLLRPGHRTLSSRGKFRLFRDQAGRFPRQSSEPGRYPWTGPDRHL